MPGATANVLEHASGFITPAEGFEMKVWELIAELSKQPAGDEVLIGIGPTLNVEADETELEDGTIVIRTDRDVEVVMGDGNTLMLSDLVKVEEEEVGSEGGLIE